MVEPTWFGFLSSHLGLDRTEYKSVVRLPVGFILKECSSCTLELVQQMNEYLYAS